MNALPDSGPESAAVGIRALKQNASAVVARAAAGESLLVTDRGRPVARLVSLGTKSRVEAMIESGLIAMPESPLVDLIREQRTKGGYTPPVTLHGEGPGLTDTLLALREEERS